MEHVDSFFDNPQFSDIKLLLYEIETGKTKLISSHKIILAKSSPFFVRLLDEAIQTNESNIKNLEAILLAKSGPLFAQLCGEAGLQTIKLKVENLEKAIKLIRWMYDRDKFVPRELETQAKAWSIIKPVEEKITYPGIRGEMILQCDESTERYDDKVSRRIEFKSKTFNSTIADFDLLEMNDGRKRVGFKSADKVPELKEYLLQYNIILGKVEWMGGHEVIEANHAKMMAKIIVKNNYFSPEDLHRIRDFFGKQVDFEN